ncbi:MAG: 4Fe-4S dicluster domain-containing protein [Pseudomonadota bacterium]
MAVRVNPRLIDDLERYGAEDVSKCYHCGNCSAACPFSEGAFIFPRRSMRYLQMGLEERLRGTLEPWLCYYCGECSDQCPRGAEPGETMMSVRRWLTSQYDFTGLSKLFYRSWKAELTAILLVAVLTGIGFFLGGLFLGGGDPSIYDGPNAFLTAGGVHLFDMVLGGFLVIILLTNSFRMWWFSIWKHTEMRPPLWDYVRQAYLLPLHFLTQKRYSQCERKQPWVLHLILVASYVTMFSLIMFFLHELQAGPEIDWRVHAFGYFASAGLLFTVIWAMRGRLRKEWTYLKHSHQSDWVFLILLLAMTVTGIVQHILHRAGLTTAANFAYVAHMMADMPMLLLVVPFGKWSHLMYRPLGMYFARLQEVAIERGKVKVPEAMAAVKMAA